MMSMHQLPQEIPPLFNNTYTPIAAAGTETQVGWWTYFPLLHRDEDPVFAKTRIRGSVPQTKGDFLKVYRMIILDSF